MPILNYTTKINVDKTIQEICSMLSRAGASAVMMKYDLGLPISLSFQIRVGSDTLPFRLPADYQPIHEILRHNPKVPKNLKTEEQAIRVSWRILKDWVAAQLAIIETKMVSTTQVFLPYLVIDGDQTVFEKFAKNPKLLGKGGN